MPNIAVSRSTPRCSSVRTASPIAPLQPTMRRGCSTAYRSPVTMMANPGSGGIFAPLVRATRGVVGTKDFNKFRGKAISAHSQIIKSFCGQIGADAKVSQGVIRLAKKNGEWLGFLA